MRADPINFGAAPGQLAVGAGLATAGVGGVGVPQREQQGSLHVHMHIEYTLIGTRAHIASACPSQRFFQGLEAALARALSTTLMNATGAVGSLPSVQPAWAALAAAAVARVRLAVCIDWSRIPIYITAVFRTYYRPPGR